MLEVLKRWQVDLIVWIDFWAGQIPAGGWFGQHKFRNDFTLLLGGSSSHRLVVLGEPPVLPLETLAGGAGKAAFKNYVYRRGQADGNFGFLLGMREDPTYRAIRPRVERAIEVTAAEYAGRVLFERVPSYFETSPPDSFLQLVDPAIGTLAYEDFNHLTDVGAARLEALIRKHVFAQFIC